MSGWEKVKLGDVLRFFNGKSIKPLAEGKYVVYGSNGPIGRSDEFQYENAIIIGRVGAACGCVAREQGKFWASDNTIVVVTHDTADIDFVFYQLSTMTLNRYAGGSAQPLVTQRILKDLEIALPPLAEQRRIAGVLRTYDEAIENCRRQISLLEEAAQRLYKEWFREEGDEKKTVGDFVHVRRGKVITKATARTGTVPVIAAGLEPAYFTDSSNVKAPCVTISASGANAGYVSLHYEDIWASDCSFVSRTETPFVFFSYELLKDKADWIRGLQKGSAQPHVHASDVEGVEMFLPDEERIREYEQRVSPLFQTCRALTRQVRLFEEARDRLLPRLLNGEASA